MDDGDFAVLESRRSNCAAELASLKVGESEAPTEFRTFFCAVRASWDNQDLDRLSSQLESLKDGYETGSFIGIVPSFYDSPVDEVHFACRTNPDFIGVTPSILRHIILTMLIHMEYLYSLVFSLILVSRSAFGVFLLLVFICVRLVAKR
jgi:hypothetical protein